MLSLNIIRSPEPEIWKSLDELNYPKYDISSYGTVRNNTTGRIIKPTIREGYCRTAIIDREGKRSTISVHILVTKMFISPCPSDEYTVDHLDRNPSNNHYRNLRWVNKIPGMC